MRFAAAFSGALLNSLLGVPVPELAAVVTKKIVSPGIRKTEPAPLWSALYHRTMLVSLSELSVVSVGEAPQASEIFLSLYLSLSHADRPHGPLIDWTVICPH